MKITLSKSQWQFIGKKAGWIKKAQQNINDINVIDESNLKNGQIQIDINKIKSLLDFGEGFIDADLSKVNTADYKDFQYELILRPENQAWGSIDINSLKYAEKIMNNIKDKYPKCINYIQVQKDILKFVFNYNIEIEEI